MLCELGKDGDGEVAGKALLLELRSNVHGMSSGEEVWKQHS